jgi:hypothetical protein
MVDGDDQLPLATLIEHGTEASRDRKATLCIQSRCLLPSQQHCTNPRLNTRATKPWKTGKNPAEARFHREDLWRFQNFLFKQMMQVSLLTPKTTYYPQLRHFTPL